MPGKTVQRLPLRIPQDPLHRQSGNQFLLSASILDRFSLGKLQSSDIQFQYPLPFSQNLPLMLPSNYRPNSHLSLSAMVHYWAYLGINPYNTPWPCSYTHISTFPRRSGALVPVTHIVRVHCIRQFTIIGAEQTIQNARGWSRCVHFGNFEDYKRSFEEARVFFELRLGNLVVRWSRLWWRLKFWEKKADAWGIERL